METILHGDCHHLECCDIESERCLKRYFTFFNPDTFEYVRYGFCNDFIRLKLNQQKIDSQTEYNKRYNEWNYFSYPNALQDFIKDFAGKIFNRHTSKWGIGYIRDYNTFNQEPTVNFSICQRPRVYAHFSLQESTDIIMSMIDSGEFISRRNEFYTSYMNTVKHELEKLLRYKKYKSQHAKCNAIINRFERNGISKWYNGTEDLIELISEFFKLKINKHESSK